MSADGVHVEASKECVSLCVNDDDYGSADRTLTIDEAEQVVRDLRKAIAGAAKHRAKLRDEARAAAGQKLDSR